jgi:putative ABC transport system permease protein
LRKQEFGIRIALGSTKKALTGLVLLDGFRTLVLGVGIGMLGAVLATRWVRSLLYETNPWDAWAIGLSVAVLGCAVLLASLLPARAAASIDPMNVLRGE